MQPCPLYVHYFQPRCSVARRSILINGLLQSPLRVLRITSHGANRFELTLLFLESEELRCKALPVGEDGRKVRCEVPDLARQNRFSLLIQHLGGPPIRSVSY